MSDSASAVRARGGVRTEMIGAWICPNCGSALDRDEPCIHADGRSFERVTSGELAEGWTRLSREFVLQRDRERAALDALRTIRDGVSERGAAALTPAEVGVVADAALEAARRRG